MSEHSTSDNSSEQNCEPIPCVNLVAQHREISSEIAEAVDRIFQTQQFVLGDEVAEFEFEVAEYCDSRETVGCASGTDALLLALMALDVGPGDEVITTPYTFFATASSIHRTGARPVFVDIDPVSYMLDPDAVEAAITPSTRVILPVHLYGQCADMEPLWRLAVRYGITIVEDAAQAIGAEFRGRRAGVLGRLGCFSFYPTKNLAGAGDGGMIATDEAELAARLRRLRNHGDVGNYHHPEVGINSRLDALQAAVLRVKLRYLDRWTEQRQANAQRYTAMIEDYGLLESLSVPAVLPERKHVFNQYCIRIGDDQRDHVRDYLRGRNIGCAVYYPEPLHLQPCFADARCGPGSLPESERAAAQTLALPIYPELTADQQERVVQTIAEALGRAAQPADSFPRLRLPENDTPEGDRAADCTDDDTAAVA